MTRALLAATFAIITTGIASAQPLPGPAPEDVEVGVEAGHDVALLSRTRSRTSKNS